MQLNQPEEMKMRDDLSHCMVHLTRDDRTSRDFQGAAADENFQQILSNGTILALRPHCLHARYFSEEKAKDFRVACFSETPLHQIKHLTRQIPGRQVKLEPYGFVFSREFLVEKGGQPVMYVNSYAGNNRVRAAADRIHEINIASKYTGKSRWLLPFLSAMHDGCDFSWEREWRVLGDVSFRPSDLVCVILPEYEDGAIRDDLAKKGVAIISPDWTFEQMAVELSRQLREANKRLAPKPAAKRLPSRLARLRT